jgi:hypothetical protein
MYKQEIMKISLEESWIYANLNGVSLLYPMPAILSGCASQELLNSKGFQRNQATDTVFVRGLIFLKDTRKSLPNPV